MSAGLDGSGRELPELRIALFQSGACAMIFLTFVGLGFIIGFGVGGVAGAMYVLSEWRATLPPVRRK